MEYEVNNFNDRPRMFRHVAYDDRTSRAIPCQPRRVRHVMAFFSSVHERAPHRQTKPNHYLEDLSPHVSWSESEPSLSPSLNPSWWRSGLPCVDRPIVSKTRTALILCFLPPPPPPLPLCLSLRGRESNTPRSLFKLPFSWIPETFSDSETRRKSVAASE